MALPASGEIAYSQMGRELNTFLYDLGNKEISMTTIETKFELGTSNFASSDLYDLWYDNNNFGFKNYNVVTNTTEDNVIDYELAHPYQDSRTEFKMSVDVGIYIGEFSSINFYYKINTGSWVLFKAFPYASEASDSITIPTTGSFKGTDTITLEIDISRQSASEVECYVDLVEWIPVTGLGSEAFDGTEYWEEYYY